MAQTIENLVARARDGDREAQSALAQRAAIRALQMAAVALGDVHSARDVSQEVAVRALRGLSRLRHPERFDAWVYRITVSEVRRSYRKPFRRREVPLDQDATAHLDRRSAAATDVLFARVELREALAQCTPRERAALALRYVHDLDDEQIADAMRCRPGTVRSMLSRGRSKLSGSPALSEHRRSPAPTPTSSVVRFREELS